MKILKVLFLTFFVIVLLGAVAIFVFLKTFDVNKYKPQIIAQIKNILGRDVHIGSLALHLSADQGVSLSIQGLTIADNPDFSKEDFFTVKSINLGVDVLSYLSKKQILVSSVEIKSPKIILIRNKEGRINAQTLVVSPVDTPSSFANINSQEPKKDPSSSSTKISLPPLLVKSIQLKDATLIYRDKMFSPALSIEASQLFLNINNLSLTDPFNFSLEASLFSQGKNIGATGIAELDMDNSHFQLSNVTIKTDLSDISVDSLVHSLPLLEPAGLGKNLEGKLQASIDKMTVGSKGLTALLMDGSLDEGKVQLKALTMPVDRINISFQATENNVKIKKSSFNLGSGKITVVGNIDDYLRVQKFHFETDAQDINLGDVIVQKDLPVKLVGKLYAQFNADGKDLNSSTSLLNSLLGEGSINIKEGKLIGINILRLVLDKMSMIPNLVEKVEQNLPEKYKESLKEKDTTLNKVNLKTFIRDGSLMVDSAEVDTDTFNLSGKGTMTFNQELNLQATIAIPKELSQSMAVAAEGLSYLQDEQGEIVIPLSVQGKMPNLRFLPDLEYLGRKVIMNKGKEELQKVLEKALGKKDNTTTPEGGQQAPPNPSGQTAPQDNQNKSPQQELIEGILDKVFH